MAPGSLLLKVTRLQPRGMHFNQSSIPWFAVRLDGKTVLIHFS